MSFILQLLMLFNFATCDLPTVPEGPQEETPLVPIDYTRVLRP